MFFTVVLLCFGEGESRAVSALLTDAMLLFVCHGCKQDFSKIIASVASRTSVAQSF